MSTLPDWIIGALSIVLPNFGETGATVYNGYAEGDYVYVAPAAAGRIAELTVKEGEVIVQGATLFRLEDAAQTAALKSAEAQVAVAKANLENLQTGGRSAEIDVIRANLDQARADQHLAETTLERTRQLFATGNVSKASVDANVAKLESANARIAQLEAQLQVAELPARDAQRIAAEASVEAALAVLDGAQTALDDRAVNAPLAGLVDKVFYDIGEVAGAGAPVVAILPPDTLKALFFVREADRMNVQIGSLFDVSCNGCAPDTYARVTRLASSPQFTPPILYSKDEVARLVFRAEAELVNADGILPGQPLTLTARE